MLSETNLDKKMTIIIVHDSDETTLFGDSSKEYFDNLLIPALCREKRDKIIFIRSLDVDEIGKKNANTEIDPLRDLSILNTLYTSWKLDSWKESEILGHNLQHLNGLLYIAGICTNDQAFPEKKRELDNFCGKYFRVTAQSSTNSSVAEFVDNILKTPHF
jgi:hypothetical protein